MASDNTQAAGRKGKKIAGPKPALARVQAVDAWAQPIEHGFFDRVPEVAQLLQKSGTDYLIEQYKKGTLNVSIDDHVRMMDRAGIAQTMLSAWHRPSGVVVSNERILEYTSKYPDRFFGVLSVDLQDPVSACQTIETYVRHHNFKAVRVLPWLWNTPPNHKLYYPLYVKCIQLDVPFCIQVGHTGPLCPSDPGRPIPYVDEVALTFPQLKMVCGHVGYPWTDEMVSLAWKYDNIYIDTSAWLPRYYPQPLRHFMSTNGTQKVLFGSNFPQLQWEQCMAQLQPQDNVLGLKGDAYEAFMAGNARRVFKLPAVKATSPTSDRIAAKL